MRVVGASLPAVSCVCSSVISSSEVEWRCVSKLLKQGGIHLVQGLKISLAMLKSKNSSMCSGVIKNLITSLQQAIHLLEKGCQK